MAGFRQRRSSISTDHPNGAVRYDHSSLTASSTRVLPGRLQMTRGILLTSSSRSKRITATLNSCESASWRCTKDANHSEMLKIRNSNPYAHITGTEGGKAANVEASTKLKATQWWHCCSPFILHGTSSSLIRWICSRPVAKVSSVRLPASILVDLPWYFTGQCIDSPSLPQMWSRLAVAGSVKEEKIRHQYCAISFHHVFLAPTMFAST